MLAMIEAMTAAGLAPAKDLTLFGDGRLIRFRVEGDKAGSRNGWAVLHDGSPAAGAFGSWRTGESHAWCEAKREAMTPEQRAALQRHMREAQAARAAEQVAVHAAARDRAAKLWARARPATDAHPYLKRKRVHAFGVRQLRDMLLIPARDVAGELHTLQFISEDGTKRFLSGGRIAGCYCAIGKPDGRLLLCEGYATGATLHQATGAAVAVCFNCGGLLAVAKVLRAKFPLLKLIVCADNDTSTAGNPGLTHAKAAARAVGGFVAIPEFSKVAAA